MGMLMAQYCTSCYKCDIISFAWNFLAAGHLKFFPQSKLKKSLRNLIVQRTGLYLILWNLMSLPSFLEFTWTCQEEFSSRVMAHEIFHPLIRTIFDWVFSPLYNKWSRPSHTLSKNFKRDSRIFAANFLNYHLNIFKFWYEIWKKVEKIMLSISKA